MAASTLPPLRGTAATGNFMSFLFPFSVFFSLFLKKNIFHVLFCFLFFAPGVFCTPSRAVFAARCARAGQAFPLKVWRRWWM